MNPMKDIEINGDNATLIIDSELFSLNELLFAADIMIEKAYLLIDKRNNKYVVNIRAKEGGVFQIVKELNAQLLHYSVCLEKQEKNKTLTGIYLAKALLREGIAEENLQLNNSLAQELKLLKIKEDLEDPENICLRKTK
jgi:hypothetical protein